MPRASVRKHDTQVFPAKHTACLLALIAAAACSHDNEPRGPWVPAAEPSWGPLPKSDAEARSLVTQQTVPKKAHPFDISLLEDLQADATKLLAGQDEIAAAYDSWVSRNDDGPVYLLFGTVHDSAAQIEAALSIALRMRTLWGLGLEQFRAAGHWEGAPRVESADDGDLALVNKAGPPDDGAVFRLRARQERYDHAAWKFGYLPALGNLLYAARGAGLPVLGCDMPPELRTQLTGGSDAERGLRELHCARSLRSTIVPLAPAHVAPDAGLADDDDPPYERFAIILGADHAQPSGLPRFLKKGSHFMTVRILGGRPKDAQGEESALATRFVVLDPLIVRTSGPDVMLLPDDVWGGSVDRASDTDTTLQPKAVPGLPRPNVTVTSDEPARFSIGESSVSVANKAEWLEARAGHDAFILVAGGITMLGAVDVPPSGYAELHFSPKERAVRIVVHRL